MALRGMHADPTLIPYSKWTINHHLAALQQYEWSHSVYRCTSQLLGVSKMTAYRWVSGFGHDRCRSLRSLGSCAPVAWSA